MSNTVKALSIFDNAKAVGKVTYKNMTRKKAVGVSRELRARGWWRYGSTDEFSLVEKGPDLVVTYKGKG